jgi:amino acid adenylation domain-containing protein
LAAFFYCAWGILLQTYCNTRDVVFGTTVSGRTPAIKGIENMVGLFINTLPLRVTAEPDDRVLDLLLNINNGLPSREKYENTPLVDIKGYSGRESVEDIFESLLVIENYPLDHLLKGENRTLPVSVHSYSIVESTPFDLNIAIALQDIIEMRFIYSEEFFAGDAIIRLSRHFIHILNEIIVNPYIPLHAIDILSLEERKQLLLDFNDIGPGFPNDKTIHGMFSEQVNRTPDHIALVGGVASPTYKGTKPDLQPTAAIALTFRELGEISNQLSCFLCGKGVQPGELVALMTRRTIEMIIGILGILKAGCAYVPLNPKTPVARQQFILADCNIRFLLTTRELLEGSGKIENCLKEGVTEVVFLDESLDFSQLHPPEPLVSPGANNLAYIIYTSGSTANPKGVPITHSNFSPLMHWGYKVMGVRSSDRTVQNLSYYFDWSVWEIFITLTSGASLYMVPGEVVLDSERYFDFIHRHAITVLHITPTHLQSLIRIQSTQKLHMLRHLCIGAEKLNCDLVERSFKLVDKRCRIYNMYGPTEVTIMSAVLEIDKSKLSSYRELSSVPIGKTLGNLVLLILDRHFSPSPLYVPGELYIGGDGVSRGYLNNPELAAEKFLRTVIRHSSLDIGSSLKTNDRSSKLSTNDRFYRTGDLARWLSDGTVEFLGRID